MATFSITSSLAITVITYRINPHHRVSMVSDVGREATKSRFRITLRARLHLTMVFSTLFPQSSIEAGRHVLHQYFTLLDVSLTSSFRQLPDFCANFSAACASTGPPQHLQFICLPPTSTSTFQPLRQPPRPDLAHTTNSYNQIKTPITVDHAAQEQEQAFGESQCFRAGRHLRLIQRSISPYHRLRGDAISRHFSTNVDCR